VLLDEENEPRSELKNTKSWDIFIWKIEEWVREFIYNQEIIGHKNALDFLDKFDPSFRISLEEAENEDWTFSALWSEELAGLALRSILKDELYNIVRALRKEASK